MGDSFSTVGGGASVLWRLLSTVGDNISTVEGYLQYCGAITASHVGVASVLWGIVSILWGYFQYCGSCSVQWGIASVLWRIPSVLWRLFSTVGDNISTVGDSFRTVEGIQYIGG